jgi:sialate O-acetylesterase
MSRDVLEKFSSEIDLSFLDQKVKQEKPQHAPTMLYNGMLAPLKNYAIKGVIWYQGESNIGEAELYSRLNPEFISMLRRLWCNNELPFYYVQIAPFRYSDSDNIEASLIREVQAKIQKEIPYTGMVVSMDCGNEGCIHPAKKKPVAVRYGFRNHCAVSVYNTFGIPASPLRTDDWTE